MVFPNPQRPTDSGTTWNIAPGTQPSLTKRLQGHGSLVLRSVDQTNPSFNTGFSIVVELSQLSTDHYPGG